MQAEACEAARTRYMKIYDKDDNTLLTVIETAEATHEVELMKSDLVRLSWVDEEFKVIPAGSYIKPFSNRPNLKYTLYQDYTPEDTSSGIKYTPEFQSPVMRLAYVPFGFKTKDSEGRDITKYEFSYVGRLWEILNQVIQQIQTELGFTFASVTCSKELTDMTISVSLDNNDILSVLSKLAEVAETEYHIDYTNRLFFFGKVEFGQPETIKVGEHVNEPQVSKSKETPYNRYIVFGSTRNMVRITDNGNFISTGTRLTLDETHYPGSIIDLRHKAEDDSGQGEPETDFPYSPFYPWKEGMDENIPKTTGILVFDDIYPSMSMYIYDLHERKKYKLDENGYPTTERWSVWYFKLAYWNGSAWTEYRLIGNSGNQSQPSYLTCTVSKKVYYDIPADGDEEDGKKGVLTDLAWGNYFPTFAYKKGVTEMTQRYVVVRRNGVSTVYKTGVRKYNNKVMLCHYDDGVKPPSGYDDQFEDFYNAVSTGNTLTLLNANNSKAPSKNLNKNDRVDGLAPMIAFQINEEKGALKSPLGTREFELAYNTEPVAFDAKDDVPDQTGIAGGYFEIIHTEEGEGLVMPTTSGQGICPKASNAIGANNAISANVVKNNKVFLFNIMPSFYDSMVTTAQSDLINAVKDYIRDLYEDGNTYTFTVNPVEQEKNNHPYNIGTNVTFYLSDAIDDNGEIIAEKKRIGRILSVKTKLDYDFCKEITIGDTVQKGRYASLLSKVSNSSSTGGGTSTSSSTYTANQVTEDEVEDIARQYAAGSGDCLTPLLFELHKDENGADTVIEPEDWQSAIEEDDEAAEAAGEGYVTPLSIKAKRGTWTDYFMSALGKGTSEGGGAELNEPLYSINGQELGYPPVGGTGKIAIVYNYATGQYEWGTAGGGEDINEPLRTISRMMSLPTQDEQTFIWNQQTNQFGWGNYDRRYLKLTADSAQPQEILSNIDMLGNFNMSIGNVTIGTGGPSLVSVYGDINVYRNGQQPTMDSVLTQRDANGLYVTKAFFSALFGAMKSNGTEMEVNDPDVSVFLDSIKAKVGFWTNQYVSALGNGTSGGGGLELNHLLYTLNNTAGVQGTPGSGETLVFENGSWTFGTTGIDSDAVNTLLYGKKLTIKDGSTQLGSEWNARDGGSIDISGILTAKKWWGSQMSDGEVKGNISDTGHIIPETGGFYHIGTENGKRYKDIHAEEIWIKGVKITADENGIHVVNSGLYADRHISALGAGTSGSGFDLNRLLNSLNSSSLNPAGQSNKVLVNDNGSWRWEEYGGGSVTNLKTLTVKGGTTNAVVYNPADTQAATLTVSGQKVSNTDVLTVTADGTAHTLTIALADNYGDTKNPYAAKSAHYVLAGPASGNATAPEFRQLAPSDISNLSLDAQTGLITIGSNTITPLTDATLKIDYMWWGGKLDATTKKREGDMSNVGNISFQATGKNIGGVVFFDTSNKRLGIGAAPDAYTLDVNGTIRTSSNLYIGSSNKIFSGNKNLLEFDGTQVALGYGFRLSNETHIHGTKIGMYCGNTLKVQVTSEGLKIGDATLTWDPDNNALKIDKGFWSESFISALGAGTSGGGDYFDVNAMWKELNGTSSASPKEIKASYMTPNLDSIYLRKTEVGTLILTDKEGTTEYGRWTPTTAGTTTIKIDGGVSDKYLPLTAGSDKPLTGALYITTSTDQKIYFKNGNTLRGSLGIDQNGLLYRYGATGSGNKIYDEGTTMLSTFANDGNKLKIAIGGQTAKSLEIAYAKKSGECTGNAVSATKLNITESQTLFGNIYFSNGVPLSVGYDNSHTASLSYVSNIDAVAYFDSTNKRLGIGQSSPQYKLDVNGTIRVGGSSYKNLIGVNNSQYLELGSHGNEIYISGSGTTMHVNRGTSNLSKTIPTGWQWHAGGDDTWASFVLGTLEAKTSIKIGGATLTWDSTNKALKIDKGFWSESFISALGAGSSSGGTDVTISLALQGTTLYPIVNGNTQTGTSLSPLLSGYAKTSDVTKKLTIKQDGQEDVVYNGTAAQTITITGGGRNTTGSEGNNGVKLFLVGASSQTEYIVTNTVAGCYIGKDGNLYSNSSKVLTTADSDSFCQIYRHELAAGKVLKITFGNRYHAMVYGRGASSAGANIILTGVGYTTASNYWRCIMKGSLVSWRTQPSARGIEVSNGSSGILYISVVAIRGAVAFEEADALSGEAVTDEVAMTSDIPSTDNFLPKTGGTLTGSLSISSGGISLGNGNISVAGKISVGGNVTASQFVVKSGTASQFLKANGTIDSTAYLPLTGGTLSSADASISRAGRNGGWWDGRDYALLRLTSYNGYAPVISMKTTSGSWELSPHSSNFIYLNYVTDTDHTNQTNNATYSLKFPKKTDTIAVLSDIPSASNFVDTSSDQSVGGAKTFTSTLRINAGIEAPNGDGLLVYAPASGWTGISSSQWGLGCISKQGVIRSSSSNLLHYKGSASYAILDASNARNYCMSLQGIGYDGAVNLPSGQNLNNILAAGTYCCQSGSIAQSQTNVPYASGNYRLWHIVNTGDDNSSSNQYSAQIALAPNEGRMFIRSHNQNSFGAWKEFAMTGDVVLTSGAQTIGGSKTFNNAATFSSTVSISGTLTAGTISGVNLTIKSGGALALIASMSTTYISGNQIYDPSTDISIQGTNKSSHNLSLCSGGGNVGVGIAAQSGYKLYVNGGTNINGDVDITKGKTIYFQHNASGVPEISIGTKSNDANLYLKGINLYFNSSIINSSDMRLKDVDELVDGDIESIARAPIFYYRWKKTPEFGPHLGSSAQYWQNVFSCAVIKDGEGYLGLDYSATALASAVITARKVLDHEERIKALEAENERLRNEVEQLKAA